MDILVKELKDYLDDSMRLKTWLMLPQIQGFGPEYIASRFETAGAIPCMR